LGKRIKIKQTQTSKSSDKMVSEFFKWMPKARQKGFSANKAYLQLL
jgi:hypothetical protein